MKSIVAFVLLKVVFHFLVQNWKEINIKLVYKNDLK